MRKPMIKLKDLLMEIDDDQMIKYKDEMGEVLEGSVGGKETYLLPKNVKLKKVDVINHMILIEFNDTEFTLTLD